MICDVCMRNVEELGETSEWEIFRNPDRILKEEVEGMLKMHPEVLLDLKYKMQKKFEKWYPENMHVINNFMPLAGVLIEHGKREYYSGRCIWQKMRWDTQVHDSTELYKLNNDYCAATVRTVIHLRPQFKDMFKLRGKKKMTPEEILKSHKEKVRN